MNIHKTILRRSTACVSALAMMLCCLQLVYAEPGKSYTDTTTVPGWSIEIQNVDGGGYIDSSEHTSGNNSMKLWNNTVKENNNTFLRVSYPVAVEKGKMYRYGFKAKVKNANGVLAQMNWGTRASLTPTGATAGWREFEFNYNHTEATGTAWLRIILDSKSESVWIDDLYFYEVGGRENTNLIQNPSFEDTPSNSAAVGGSGEREIITVSHKDDIHIDGDLSDWDNINFKPIDKKTVYNGSLTLEAKIGYAYDDDNFYFAVEAEDDVHFPVMQDQYWTGDGLQFTLCGLNDTFGKAYAYNHDIENNKDFVSPSEQLKHGFSRTGNTTIYEVAIPWTDYFADGKQDAALFCCILNENDNDGLGRKGCLMVSEGIAAYKGSDQYPMFLMVDTEAGYTSWMSGPKNCSVGDEAEYRVELFNSSNADKTITLVSDKAKLSDTVTLAAGKNTTYKFTVRYDVMGEHEVDITLSDGKTEKHQSVKTEALANAEIAEEVIQKHKAEYAELVPLMEECKKKGMNLDYDEINYNILNYFVGYMEENLEKGDTIRVAHQDKVLTELYEKTKANLTAYLDGTAMPLSAPTYVTSDISLVGKHFEATVDKDGILEQQPVFFVGTGHWAPSLKDIPILSKFGFNAIQPELGGRWGFMNKAAAVRGWAANANGYEAVPESVDKEKYSGERALKISATGARIDRKYWDLTQTIEVKPNTTYEYGLCAKGDNVNYAWFTVDPTWSAANKRILTGTYDWTEHNYEYTTGANQTSLTFYITVEDSAAAVYIDEAFIREKGSNKNLLYNGDFEKPTYTYWDMDERTIEKFVSNFDLMEKYNLSGWYSAAAHYIPPEYLNDNPGLGQSNEYPGIVLEHPKSKEYYEQFYRTIMPRLANKPAFDGVILMNEPHYYTNRTSYYLPLFQEAMKNKYGEIEKLNANWGTDYTDFDDVSMPVNMNPTPQVRDYLAFNDEAIPNWNRYVSGIIKEYDTNVLIQTKMMQTLGKSSIGRLDGSNNWETIAPTLDVNSCDGWAYYQSPTLDIRGQNLFYDYQTSIKEAPICNTEDHIIQDGETMIYNDAELAHAVATMWQGAVHGKGCSVVWFWDREERSESGQYLHNPLLTERPDLTAALGKMTLDLNRLAKEIVSITDSPANVGMLYTGINNLYVDGYMNTMYQTYCKLGENGQKTQFVVESDIDKINNVKACVIPHVVTVTDNTFEAIKNYVDKGGKLIVLGKDSLTKDEYGHERSADDVGALMTKAEVIDIKVVGTSLDSESVTKIGNTINNLVKTEGYSDISIIDKATGKPLEGCEYLYAKYNGKYVINLCTYRDDDREIEIYVNGKKAERFIDMISTKTYIQSAQAESYTPMLLCIED